MWSFIHKLGSPRWCYGIAGRWLPWLGLLALTCLGTGLVWGLLLAPPDFRQGNSYRIIYLHVPTAFISLAGYYLMALAGAVYLIWRIKVADMVLKVSALIGAAMALLTLVTGGIWGKPTWGTWWVWDARTTSMLILFFLYVGVALLHDAFSDKPEQGGRVCAILALVGTVNIPIIYKSVDWWFSLHQPATIRLTGAPSMDASMFQPLLLCILGMYLLYGFLLLLHLRVEILARESGTQWVQERLLREHGSGGLG